MKRDASAMKREIQNIIENYTDSQTPDQDNAQVQTTVPTPDRDITPEPETPRAFI